MNSKFKKEGIDAAPRRWWQDFDVVFGIPFVVATHLHVITTLSLDHGLLPPAVILGGITCITVGGVLVIFARREIARYGQPTDPGRPTRKLITTGVFAISRNPLYLGGVCIVVGIALTLNLAWVLVFLPVALLGCRYILIAPE